MLATCWPPVFRKLAVCSMCPTFQFRNSPVIPRSIPHSSLVYFLQRRIRRKEGGQLQTLSRRAAVFANERLLLPALRPLLSPPRRPSAILPLKPEFYSRNAALARLRLAAPDPVQKLLFSSLCGKAKF